MPRSSGRGWRNHGLLVLLLGVGVLVALGVLAASGWRDVLAARNRLVAAKGALSAAAGRTGSMATADGRATAGRRIDSALRDVTSAGSIVDGSLALRVARYIPLLSSQRSGLVHLVADSRTALVSSRTLLTDVNGLAEQGKVTRAKVPLAALAAFDCDLRQAATMLGSLRRSGAGLVAPLGRARRAFNVLATSTADRLRSDADAVKVAQSLMGAGGQRHYFVALENNAEMRDQGAVLSYAAVTFDHGQLHVDQHGSTGAAAQTGTAPTKGSLVLKQPAGIAIPAGTAAVFGSTLPTYFWANVDATADFAFSGRAMQAMYRDATGQTVDGVFALDVPALSALLAELGSVTVPGVSSPITADNAGTVLLHDLYDAFPPGDQNVRHELLSEVATAVVGRLGTGTFDPIKLAQRLAVAAAGGHVRAWSADAGEEALLERGGLGGGPAVTAPDRTFHVAVENRNATKMDYYIETATRQQIEITPAGSAIIRTTIAVHNTAPVGTKASYAAGPDGYGTTQPGEYWAWVLLWGPSHAMQPGSLVESGLSLSQTVLDRIYAGQTRQETFITVIPGAVRNGTLHLRYVPQPRLVDPTLEVTITSDGWHMKGPAGWSGPWNKTIHLTWELHR